MNIVKSDIIADKGLLYEPAPLIDPGFTQRFNEIVPICPNGKDRYLRLVWGCDRTEFLGGHQVHRYGDVRHPAKYVGRTSFVVEAWQTPAVYDELEWNAQEELLGPFPREGVFDFVEYHGDGIELCPIDERVLNYAKMWRFWQNQGKKRSVEYLIEQRAKRLVLQNMRKQERADEIGTQFGEDVVKEFEAAQASPNAFGDQIKKRFADAFQTTPSGILIPKN